MKESLQLKEILIKREEYAVSLRTKKRQQRVNFKRKLNENFRNQDNSAIDHFHDDSYQNSSYSGYYIWTLSNYNF